MSKTLTRPLVHAGFTLLEVILALAILAGSIAVLGEIIRQASRNASDAAGEGRAQMIARSLVDELAVGVLELKDTVRQPVDVEDRPGWLYSVTLTDTTIEGLTAVEVIVEQDLEERMNPIKYQLVRWFSNLPSANSASTGGVQQQQGTGANTSGQQSSAY